MAASGFSTAFRSALAGVAAMGLAVHPANAEEQPQQYAANTNTPQPQFVAASIDPGVELVNFAAGDAIRWAGKNDGVAVSVKLGTESLATPQQIIDILTRELETAGAKDFKFFFEQNDIEATYLSYHYGKNGGAGNGPYLLGASREGARIAARQNAFYLENPELGM